MLNRGQFTFYRSFWEAIKVLPKKDRLPILEAIISYALDGAPPSALSQSQLAFFSLVKPTLDSSRKKAESGKQGGKTPKQTESKPQANGKQTAREKEGENEKEIEEEIEGEKDKEQTESAPVHFDGKAFTFFWDAYPRKIGREDAWEAWKELSPSTELVQAIMHGLEGWKKSTQWTDDGGRYVPKATKFLREQYWACPPASETGKQTGKRELDEDEIAAMRRMMEESE